MKIGIITPTRGDREDLLDLLPIMLDQQTIFKGRSEYFQNQFFIKIKTDEHELVWLTVDSLIVKPTEQCDITKRYKIGYDFFRNKGYDILFFMEDDDYYAPDYIKTMLYIWKAQGRPNLFGLNRTIYYHIGLKKYFQMNHKTRSSAMNTIIKPDLTFDWCPDHEPFTDIHLWHVCKLNGVIVEPPHELCLGIKHGIGKSGGNNHIDHLDRFVSNPEKGTVAYDDQDLSYLSSIVKNEEVLNFYKNFEWPLVPQK